MRFTCFQLPLTKEALRLMSEAGPVKGGSVVIAFIEDPDGYKAVDYQWDGDQFATADAQVDIWDHSRLKKRKKEELLTFVVFHFLGVFSDRSITLYDRLLTPVRKLIMQTETKAFCWNLMEPMNFADKSNSLPLSK
ncbi:hypothetical protein C5167_046865 [Papaver somniferum]|uniref:Uncharacterized protein n=1 Tax=Papaver somniferum TaxID=3469 RepID=A0A4Y7LIS8_PAPSO|nr:hypothetical protein C5167_046865 [Papaver somniferum]